MGKVERGIDTVLVNYAGVHIRSAESDEGCIGTCTRAPDVVAMVIEIVELDVKSLEQGGIEAHIELVGLLVCGSNGRHGTQRGGSINVLCGRGIHKIVGRSAADGIALGVVCPDIHVVAWQVVGIELAERCAELQVVEP